MPRRFLMFLLCAVLALPAPLAWGQTADLQSVLSGVQHPLTLKVKDLDSSWRQISLGTPDNSLLSLLRGGIGLASTSITPLFTKGETVSIAGETFLIGYHHTLSRGELEEVMQNGNPSSATLPVQTPDMVLTLSLVNIRLISGLDDVRAFAPLTPEDARRQADAAYESRSLSNLKQIGLAMAQYIQDNDEKLPPMKSAAVTKKALFPFVKTDAVFQQPQTHDPYLPNTSLSGRSLASFKDPSSMVIYYEAGPAPDGTRGVVFLDGHARRIRESEWPALKSASHVPNVPAR